MTPEERHDIQICQDASEHTWLRYWSPGLIDAVRTTCAVARRTEILEAEIVRLQKIIDGLAARVVDQSELLSRKAEKASHERHHPTG